MFNFGSKWQRFTKIVGFGIKNRVYWDEWKNVLKLPFQPKFVINIGIYKILKNIKNVKDIVLFSLHILNPLIFQDKN